jgi:hypothetical protein
MKANWLRWTVPPGVSIAVHAVLIGVVAYIGMQISAQGPSKDALPIAELAVPAPPEIPEDSKTEQVKADPRSNPSQQQPSTQFPPSELDAQAADLKAIKYTTPAMDPVSLEALRTSNAQIASPTSTAPPTVRFAGVQTRAARKIVYVVDGSGATANSFAYLQSQLLRSIDRLSPTQRFQVVLFRSFDEHSISHAPMNNNKLARATPTNKQRVADWLSAVSARGRSNPVEGLRAALSLKPDLVLLITRSIERTEMGWADGQRSILQELNELNPQNPTTGKRPAIIKTIQLLDEDPTGIMRAIGTFHGDGTNDYRVVTYNDLVSPDDAGDPDDLSTRSIGATNEQRIASANDLMGSLTQSGTSFSVFYAYPDAQQRERALQGAKQIQSLTKPLAHIDGRAAILDAQSTLLIHISSPGTVSDSQLNSIIESLDGVMYTEPNTDAQRVMTVALARALLGQHDHARVQMSELIELADDLGLDQTTRAQSLLALVSMGIEPSEFEMLTDRPPFVTTSGAIDAVWGLILRETMTKSRLAMGVSDAWEPMTQLRVAASSNESIRNYIDTRIALILESAGAPEPDVELPTEVLLAAANTMSHSMDRRERAMDLLSEIAQRQNDPSQTADALWQIGVLGRAINTTDSRERSAQALTDLATRFPEDRHASDAIAGAIHATPSHEEGLMRDRLELGVSRFPDHLQIDLWRLALAEMLADFARLDVLDPISPNTREGVLAGELYEQTVLGMMDRYTDAQIRRGLGLRMRDAATRFNLPGADLWTKRAAIIETELDPQGAMASIDQLIMQAQSKNQPTDELELLRAQTLNRLGQTRSAFEALSRLSARIDSTGNHTSTYWQAWSLMLETIAENGSSQDKADAIRHIARLELIDQNLGGSPWRQRITASRQTLHSSP